MPAPRVCAQCFSPEGQNRAKLLVCTRCTTAFYCSKTCQTKHWKAGHKQACAVPVAAGNAPSTPLGRVDLMSERGRKREHGSRMAAGSDGGGYPRQPADAECAVCQDPLSSFATCTLPCGHTFHAACVEGLRSFGVNNLCGVCGGNGNGGSSDSCISSGGSGSSSGGDASSPSSSVASSSTDISGTGSIISTGTSTRTSIASKNSSCEGADGGGGRDSGVGDGGSPGTAAAEALFDAAVRKFWRLERSVSRVYAPWLPQSKVASWVCCLLFSFSPPPFIGHFDVGICATYPPYNQAHSFITTTPLPSSSLSLSLSMFFRRSARTWQRWCGYSRPPAARATRGRRSRLPCCTTTRAARLGTTPSPSSGKRRGRRRRNRQTAATVALRIRRLVAPLFIVPMGGRCSPLLLFFYLFLCAPRLANKNTKKNAGIAWRRSAAIALRSPISASCSARAGARRRT